MTALCAIVAYLLGFSFWLGMCRGRRDPWPDAILLAAIWPLAFAWHRAKFGTFAAFLLLALVPGQASAGKYIKTLLDDPLHPPLSAGVTFDARMKLNGGATMAAVVYHPADPENSLVPQRLLDLGVRPIGWAVNLGLGGTPEEFVVPFGASANLTPTVLGPGLDLMKKSSSAVLKTVATAIDGPSGGIAFGPQWTTKLMRGGVILPLNEWRFPPGWFVGGLWKFGGPK